LVLGELGYATGQLKAVLQAQSQDVDICPMVGLFSALKYVADIGLELLENREAKTGIDTVLIDLVSVEVIERFFSDVGLNFEGGHLL
jgi:hypothetical protein